MRRYPHRLSAPVAAALAILGLLVPVVAGIPAAPPAEAATTLSVRLASSKSTIRPDNTFTITLKFDNISEAAPNGIAAFQVTLAYPSAILEYRSAAAKAMTGTELIEQEVEAGSILLAYADDDGGESPIRGKTDMLVLTFAVRSTATPGSAAFAGTVDAMDTIVDESIVSVAASFTPLTLAVGAPLSANNYLKSLQADPGPLSPAFARGTTSYSLSVPHTVGAVTLAAAAEDAKAKVSGAGTVPLGEPGTATTATITVTAESGASRKYTVEILRLADPDATPTEPPTPTPDPNATPTPTPTEPPPSPTPSPTEPPAPTATEIPTPFPTPDPGDPDPADPWSGTLSIREKALLTLVILEAMLIVLLLALPGLAPGRRRRRRRPTGADDHPEPRTGEGRT